MSRSLVCAVGLHPDCDGGSPNGPSAKGPCDCPCHEVMSPGDGRPQVRHRPWPAPLGLPHSATYAANEERQ